MAGKRNLACAICRHDEAEPVVCHHCGKLLCSHCRQSWPDTGFAGGRRLPSAYHCPRCLQRYHVKGRDLLQVAAGRSSPVSRPQKARRHGRSG